MIRSAFLHFALPDLDDTELAEIKEALDTGWITTGPKVHQFETDFAAFVGARHAVAVNSATAAMHLALEAIGLQADDEVITTPYTFASTAEVVRYFGAKPVFVDVDAADFNIDCRLIEQAVTPRTRAILPVHIGGLAADLDAVYAVAARHGLAVVEDAAHSFPTLYNGRLIGAPSREQARGEVRSAICFSFYATKTITTAEGGMICTDDEALAERCRVMSLHGISKDAWKRYTAEGSWYYEIIAPGFKHNMSDIAAAMGLAQLRKVERMRKRRVEIAGRYSRAFGPLPQLQLPAGAPDGRHSWHLYMLRLNQDTLSVTRSQFIEELKQRNIGASVHFIPLHLHPYYRETYGYQPEDFPVSYREYQREISLPIYSKMSDQDVDDVIGAVVGIVEQYRK
ncbi:MAG: DegT/DnrJ/EryC1/StrS family aminotransferase [Anaerolineae bacterium]|nr:DegT/DnrJ/EryC1/StrS family aminotransferase [Anaerolineae bacterium]